MVEKQLKNVLEVRIVELEDKLMNVIELANILNLRIIFYIYIFSSFSKIYKSILRLEKLFYYL